MRNILKTASVLALIIGSSAAYASPLAFPPDAGQALGAREISTENLDRAVGSYSGKPVARGLTMSQHDAEELQFMRADRTQS